ncbi:hypothetical protein [Streptomyces indicus]|uniref:Uncharacterized protein n=1 Tax=Streptomyces indicus TaxID=417292 RepID=A0A1G9GX65_9ACTN|nr:hypothetical protein [Streptomyces indicus]SDL05175.1 hypothetical protein SAMN05421806_11765 [Streptomyces indicus]
MERFDRDGADAADGGSALVRAVMERTAEELPVLPDLSGAARAEGRRRRNRARAGAVAGVLAVAVTGLFGANALAGGGSSAAKVPVASAPDAGSEAERQIAAALQRLLPADAGEVRLVPNEKAYPLNFKARLGETPFEPCGGPAKGKITCNEITLPDGRTSAPILGMPPGPKQDGVTVLHRFRGDEVEFRIYPRCRFDGSEPLNLTEAVCQGESPTVTDIIEYVGESRPDKKQ